MEIVKYTNFELDEHVYGKNELVGILDKTGGFIYESLYDIKTPLYNGNLPVNIFLAFGAKNKKLKANLISELEIGKELLKRPLKNLSTTETVKILSIKMMLSDCKTILFDFPDSYFNYKDLEKFLKTIRTHLKEANKTAIFTTNKPDNLLFGSKYIVVNDQSIIYNGNDFKSLPEPIETVEFAHLANTRGAKLDDYKEPSDLLKAIYRSVQ
ncbi:MAG TPA: hypothetical protein DCY94_03300 [Firmicutes bacterium]|nr:hypothetical protein [Bacillota bacterium]